MGRHRSLALFSMIEIKSDISVNSGPDFRSSQENMNIRLLKLEFNILFRSVPTKILLFFYILKENV